jgi:hypothetical protein
VCRVPDCPSAPGGRVDSWSWQGRTSDRRQDRFSSGEKKTWIAARSRPAAQRRPENCDEALLMVAQSTRKSCLWAWKKNPDLPTDGVGCRLSSLEARSFQSWCENLRSPRRVTRFRYSDRKGRHSGRRERVAARGVRWSRRQLESRVRYPECRRLVCWAWRSGRGSQKSDQGRNSSTSMLFSLIEGA